MPEDLPPPFVPAEDDGLEATGRMEPVKDEAEPELDPRELKALSRQERKEAKAALRREQQEARNAARQAKAMAKAAAKVERVAPDADAAADATDQAPDAGVAEEIPADVEPTVAAVPADEETGESEAPESAETAPPPAPTDPRARAAQRVQRRLGKDADKVSAAEARARAREEARRRRAQAKEQRSGTVAEEAVVRPPEEPAERNLAEDVSVVEPLAEETAEAGLPGDELLVEQKPADDSLVVEPVADELVADEAEADEPAADEAEEPVVEEPETDLPKPDAGQRIDQPAPDDRDEPASAVTDEPEPAAAWTPSETREISTPVTVPADGEESSKRRTTLAPIAGVVGLIALGVSVLLAVGALLVALGFDSGGLYEALRTVANLLVGPLEGAFDFSGANAERKEHFLAWGAGSIGYLLISFVGQAVQRANDND